MEQWETTLPITFPGEKINQLMVEEYMGLHLSIIIVGGKVVSTSISNHALKNSSFFFLHHRNIVAHLLASEEFKSGSIFGKEPTDTANTDSYAERIGAVLRDTFLNVDRALIDYCAQRNLHYASSTGVAAFLWQNVLTVAHIGDSKACMAKVIDGRLQPEWLTVDHKPNMPSELQRIQSSGGSLAWLHGNKPYIR